VAILALVVKDRVLLLMYGCAPRLHDVSQSQKFESSDQDAIILVRVTPKAALIVESGEADEYGFRGDHVAALKEYLSQDGYAILKVPPPHGADCYGIVAVRPDKYASRADERPFTYSTVMWHKSIVRRQVMIVALSPLPGLVPAAAIGASAAAMDFRGQDSQGRAAYSPRERVDLPIFRPMAGEVAYVGGLRIDATRRDGSVDAPKRIAITPMVSAEDAEAAAGFLATHYPNLRMEVTFRPFEMVPRDELGDN
jgi:hypothetical protein